ncbi:MAG TPA: hypothetical protein PLF91_08200, partial [Mycolicibacterium fallax]|nr:hypothetical protein [Mycolicibacterium fallax]
FGIGAYGAAFAVCVGKTSPWPGMIVGALLAAVTAVLTPLTMEAGEWLEDRVTGSEALERHEDLGKTMLYVAIALVIAAILVAVLHRWAMPTVPAVLVAVVVVALSVGAAAQLMRIGESGAEAAWGEVVSGSSADGD